ncbi:D-aminoacyl-tRNA deacylase [Coprothermobacter platensis]|uniref:D-aminoacyl-tRNA deacylase n=1 Tax=Coprothermobacter platensis TaxID=108819 RepID=UPI000373C58E|nr:D-aminoacyl-tRNA deacylase [Coprothermobacter platensis]
MILAVSRVREASLLCDGVFIGRIGNGLACFVGIEKNDTRETSLRASSKIPNIRIFEDERGKLSRSLNDVDGDIMIISNFTLAGNLDGKRMSFDNAMAFDEARDLFDAFCCGIPIKNKVCSIFGSYMDIMVRHDGPVNVVLRF